MKRLLLLALTSSLPLVGCDSDGDSDTDAGESSSTTGPTDPTATTDPTSSTDPTASTDPTSATTTTTTATTTTATSGSSSSTATASTTDASSSGGSESSGSDTGSDEESLCLESDGTWDEGSCGHYACGVAPSCEAIIPGCDCGPDSEFVEGEGCVENEDCSDPETICENTGGTWEPLSCGHYDCGMPPLCEAIIPGCDCGPEANYIEGEGCVANDECGQFQFYCGAEVICVAPSQFCNVVHPGQPGPSSYDCYSTPAECADDYSCDCINPEFGPSFCDEGFDGSVTVTTALP